MLSWSQRRKYKIIGGVVLALLIFFVIPSFIILRDKPTCSNGVRDEGEKGVDCGGVCILLCKGNARAPVVRFSRVLKVSQGVWNSVTLLENKNLDSGWRSAPYTLKIYDDNNLIVAERHGELYIPPKNVFTVFEGGIDVGKREPTRATFEFTSPARFERMTPDPVINIRSKRFVQSIDGSRLDVSLYNPSRIDIGRFELSALLFDSTGNVFAASATVEDEIHSLSTLNLSFTWPSKLPEPERIEVLYTVPSR